MLLDAHGGAVAAGGHGLRRAAAAGVMGLCCCCGGAGRSLCSAPGSLQHWGVSEKVFLWVYAAAAFVDEMPTELASVETL